MFKFNAEPLYKIGYLNLTKKMIKIENTQSEILTKIGNRFRTLLMKYEIYIVIITLIGIVLQALSIEVGNYIMIFSFSLIVVCYYFDSFAITEDKNTTNFEKFVDRYSEWAGCIALLGILYKLSNWPMYGTMLLLGTISILIACPVMIVIKTRKKELTSFDKRILMRVSILLLTSGLLYLFLIN